MKNIKKVIFSALIVVVLGASLTSCATASLYANHKDLTITSKMSSSVFLDPVPKAKRVIFVDIKNTTTQDIPLLEKSIIADLKASGWTITDDPTKAFYMLQANVLQAGEAKSNKAANSFINQGYSSLVSGAALGAGVGFISQSGRVGGIVGLGVAGADYVGQLLVKDKTYSIITDIQVSQKINGKISEKTNGNLQNGSSSTSQSYSSTTNWKKTRVRVGTIADQINLKLKTAMPKIEVGLAKEIAGIFG